MQDRIKLLEDSAALQGKSLTELESRIARIQATMGKRDGWGKVEIVFGGLTPLLIGVAAAVTTYFSHEYVKESGQAELQLKREEFKLKATETDIKLQELGIRRMDYIADKLKDLRSSDPAVVRETLYLLGKVEPDGNPEALLQIASFPNLPEATKAQATDLLFAPRRNVVALMFDEERANRLSAWNTLRRSWTNDSEAVSLIVEMASTKYKDDPNRIYSAVAILKYFTSAALNAKRPLVEAFLKSIPMGPDWRKTQIEVENAKRVLNRLQTEKNIRE